MEPVALLSFIRKLLALTEVRKFAEFFAQQAHEAVGSGSVTVYAYNHSGHELSPVAVTKGPMNTWPAISMDEVNNPLVYALISGKPCQVNNVSMLVDVGAGFEQYRSCLVFNDGLMVYPLLDALSKFVGVLAVQGRFSDVRNWANDVCWIGLLDIFTQQFAQLMARQLQDENFKANRAYEGANWQRKVKDQAKRFIEMEFVGRSEAAVRLRAEMLQLADSSLSVLITGETGVGKDYIAMLLHKLSLRSGAFVPVNSAAIARDLVGSELFGSVKGAYTGAQNRDGLVAAADKGTLFLDEIGDMPLPLQASLLRLLNEKKYRPIGGNKELVSDFRLICATNKPLLEMVKKGEFREDLYFRIRQACLNVPPLRKRLVDLGAICHFFIAQYNQDYRKHIAGIESNAVDLLKLHGFPGNVRELKSLIQIACERTHEADLISAETIGSVFSSLSDVRLDDLHGMANMGSLEPGDMEALFCTDDLAQAKDRFEQLLVNMRLKMVNGSRSAAAKSLGIPKRTLARKCLRWNL